MRQLTRRATWPYILLMAYIFLPILIVLAISFSEPQPAGGIKHFGSVKSWQMLWDLGLWKSCLQSTFIAVAASSIAVGIAWLSVLDTRLQASRIRRIILLAVLTPLLVNVVVRALAFIRIARGGVLFEIFSGLPGVGGYISSFGYSIHSVLWGFVYVYVPYVYLLLWSEAEEIEEKYLVAARDLGGTPEEIRRRIIAPSLAAPTRYVWFFLSVTMSADFVVPNLFAGGKYVLGGQAIDLLFFQYHNWPASAAMALLLMVGSAAVSWTLLIVYRIALARYRRMRGPKCIAL